LKSVIVERSIAVCHVFADVTVFERVRLAENHPGPTLLDQAFSEIAELKKQSRAYCISTVDFFCCRRKLCSSHYLQCSYSGVFVTARYYCLVWRTFINFLPLYSMLWGVKVKVQPVLHVQASPSETVWLITGARNG
jgi:hypothetical protein